MHKTTGLLQSWDPTRREGLVKGDDGKTYTFTRKEWVDSIDPEVDGAVIVLCENGRDVSRIEHTRFEHITLSINMSTPSGVETRQIITVGGPHRMHSDSLAWMSVAKGLHDQLSHHEITDISALLQSDHELISYKGSVVKYCFSLAIELYFKWIYILAGEKFAHKHPLLPLFRNLPKRAQEDISKIYDDYRAVSDPTFMIKRVTVHGSEELKLDWTTFEQFLGNVDKLEFTIGRYAAPGEYSIFESKLEPERQNMNTYMVSNDFFELASRIMSYSPNPGLLV